METLTTLFGSPVKVKVLRLFLFNEDTPYFMSEIVSRTKCSSAMIRREVALLTKINLLKHKHVTKDIEVIRKGIVTIKKAKGVGYTLDESFPYKDLLKNLMTVASIQADETLMRRFSGIGRVKLIIASVVFIQNWDSRVDLLIVGEELNLPKIESIIRVIESEIGKEIAYSAFETSDFEYRIGIHDRLVRDILDYNHVTLLDRIGIEPQ